MVELLVVVNTGAPIRQAAGGDAQSLVAVLIAALDTRHRRGWTEGAGDSSISAPLRSSDDDDDDDEEEEGKVPRRRPSARPWVGPGRRDAMIESGAKLLRFAFGDDEIAEEHRTHVLRDVLWSVTEVGGTYETRFQSGGVLRLEDDGVVRHWRSQLRHDHVVTRKTLADRIRGGEDPARVLADSEACTVTKDEHDRLSAYDTTLAGWARYRAAGIEVVDMLTGEPIDLDAMPDAGCDPAMCSTTRGRMHPHLDLGEVDRRRPA